jgi:hypothetical protein
VLASLEVPEQLMTEGQGLKVFKLFFKKIEPFLSVVRVHVAMYQIDNTGV